MARQKGILKISGTLDGINYYFIKGVGYARKAGGGFNSKAIRTQPNMQRVRENASEFGHCSQVKKCLRLALMPFLHGYKDSTLHGRMMSLLTTVKALDLVSKRGFRRVGIGLQTAKGRTLLRQFAFTPHHKLLEAVTKYCHFDWASQKLSLSDLKVSDFKSPKPATHIGISLGVMDFDFEGLTSSLEVSPTQFFAIDSDSISFELIPEVVVAPTYIGLVVLGIRYYEVIDNEVYTLNSQIGVGLLDVRV
ncbi:hypothetical protein [Gaetbulibacter sp. PBL-D1]|uniref:hypothetical protein n=1 Tax=Gaetbulibacter sp. PBL-D1 TaxID=3422594 RepID=UPI003D2F4637